MKLDNLIREHGLEMACKLDHDGGYSAPSKWSVTITNGRGVALETPFTMGAAFRELPQSALRSLSARDQARIVSHIRHGLGGISLFDEGHLKKSVPQAPELSGVLYSLSLDAEYVRHGQTLSEFGRELGYTDLQEGLDAYSGCLAAWRGLVQLGLDLDALAEAVREWDEV